MGQSRLVSRHRRRIQTFNPQDADGHLLDYRQELREILLNKVVQKLMYNNWKDKVIRNIAGIMIKNTRRQKFLVYLYVHLYNYSWSWKLLRFFRKTMQWRTKFSLRSAFFVALPRVATTTGLSSPFTQITPKCALARVLKVFSNVTLYSVALGSRTIATSINLKKSLLRSLFIYSI